MNKPETKIIKTEKQIPNIQVFFIYRRPHVKLKYA